MNKSIDIKNSGQYVTDVNDILQSWGVILNTIKGSDPLRPEFGCSIFDYLDKPFNSVRGEMISTIIDELENYEPRATINKVAVDMIEIGSYKITITGTITSTNEDVAYVDVISLMTNDALKIVNHKAFDISYDESYN